MKLPNGLEQKDVMHPNGLFFRNPSNIDIRSKLNDQSKIVKTLTNAGKTLQTEVFRYRETDAPFTMPGILKIRELNQEQLENLFKNLLRIRPNVLKLHIKFGEYKTIRPILDRKVQNVGGMETKHQTDLAKDIAAVLSDSRLLVVELIYTVHNAELGKFSSSCEAFGVATEEEYKDNKLFEPGVLIEYFPNI